MIGWNLAHLALEKLMTEQFVTNVNGEAVKSLNIMAKIRKH
ncbi:MAG: hypothetical protein ACTS5F_01460 [Candidatus Hodgkinia cicadicola]